MSVEANGNNGTNGVCAQINLARPVIGERTAAFGI